MSVEFWWNDTQQWKTEVLGEIRVPLSVLSQQIPQGLTWIRRIVSAIRIDKDKTCAMACAV